jgi:TonB family protein
MKIFVVTFFSLFPAILFSQDLIWDCYDSTDKLVPDSLSEYCVVGKKILRVDRKLNGISDTVATYTDTVRAYFAGGDNKLKFLRIYNTEGYQHGNYVEFYRSGKLKERGSSQYGKNFGYVTRFHPNGKTWSTLQFFSEKEKISDLEEADFRIMTYNDSSGVSLVKSGNGFCRCILLSGRTEVGKVVDGLRDSIWNEYSGDTLVLQEYYQAGKFVEGTRFYKGRKIKYRKYNEGPAFSQGEEGIERIIAKNLKLPASIKRSATVYLSLTVNEEGKLENAKILRGINKECDREAIRVVNLLSKWHPSRLRGKPMTTKLVLPLKFNLR